MKLLKLEHNKLKKSINAPGNGATQGETIASCVDDEFAFARALVDAELDKDKLREYAAKIDKDYKAEMIACVDWTHASSHLINDSRMTQYYNEFEERFPFTHMLCATVISSRYYSVPMKQCNKDDRSSEVQQL